MKVLFIGDIVGSPGRLAVEKLLPALKEKEGLSFVVANAENSAGGMGVTPKTAEELFALGIDVLTNGDHIWDRKEVVDIVSHPFIIRPLNISDMALGKGFCIIDKNGTKLAVINLQGRVFMRPVDCPFNAVKKILPLVRKETHNIIVDIHAEATSEKRAMGFFLDGQVSACVGTHTHVQTADEQLLPLGSAYITDTGMTGPCDSIIGRKKEKVIEAFVSGMPSRFEVATDDIQLQTVIIDIDESCGKAKSIKRVIEKIK